MIQEPPPPRSPVTCHGRVIVMQNDRPVCVGIGTLRITPIDHNLDFPHVIRNDVELQLETDTIHPDLMSLAVSERGDVSFVMPEPKGNIPTSTIITGRGVVTSFNSNAGGTGPYEVAIQGRALYTFRTP